MEIKTFSPSEQIDPAVDLGVVPPPLPEILNLEQLVAVAVPPPPLIIEGVLHQGCKMILGGTSKSNKSWCLLDLALSVASGQPWWGRKCVKLPVVYINFELHVWAVVQRINALCGARPDCKGMLIFDKVESLEEIYRKISEITSSQLMETANNILEPKKLSTLIYQ